MIVRFNKKSARHYSITIMQTDGTRLGMNQGPGHSQWLPHDLQHLIVEKVLHIKSGIFGQVAAGGTAGTFHELGESGSKRERSRRRRALKKKGRSLSDSGQDDAARSERATIVGLHHWMERSNQPQVRAEANRVREAAVATLEGMTPRERAAFSRASLHEIASEMERLSSLWQETEIGDYLEVTW